MTAQIKTKENVLEAILKNQDEIKALGVRRTGLFGSFVRMEEDQGSDLSISGIFWMRLSISKIGQKD